MKRVVLIVFLLVVFVAAVCAWIVLGSGTGFTAKSKALYIRSDAATPKAVLDSLLVNRIITNETAFDFLAS
ncbi:MAG TPA: hypothetical protein VFR58_10390, partial [Flavisolibacter sp.]|nr:hypothetical protein [Flavisolibacter sp.]